MISTTEKSEHLHKNLTKMEMRNSWNKTRKKKTKNNFKKKHKKTSRAWEKIQRQMKDG